jgi:hypothetical protein
MRKVFIEAVTLVLMSLWFYELGASDLALIGFLSLVMVCKLNNMAD